MIAHTDYHAARLEEVAESMNIAIPRELAIIAYDDELADSAPVPLTAVTAPRLEVGRTALAMMLSVWNPPTASKPCATSNCYLGSPSVSPADTAHHPESNADSAMLHAVVRPERAWVRIGDGIARQCL